VNRILKGEGPPPDSTPRDRVLPGEVHDARERAREILAQAEKEAAALRAAALADAQEARRRGLAEGHEEGLARATEVLARAHAERDALLSGVDREVVDLALGAARKILGREVSERAAAVEIVAQALAAVRRARQVRVRVSPEDALVLRAAEPILTARLAQGAGFELLEDPGIARGGCIVETESGQVDARLESQLAALRRALLGGE
jgi:type III secretion system HrpE/YscL family protein